MTLKRRHTHRCQYVHSVCPRPLLPRLPPTTTPFTVIVFSRWQSCQRDLPRIVASNSHQFLVFAAFSINIQIAIRNLLGNTDTLHRPHPPLPVQISILI